MAYEVEPPKYVRLAQTLQRRIEDGTYAPGTRVASENQLVQAFAQGPTGSVLARIWHAASDHRGQQKGPGQ
jgi:hypothetical protein